MEYKQSGSFPTELIMGIIGPIGCNRELVISTICNIAKHFKYEVEIVKVSDLIRKYTNVKVNNNDQFSRVMSLMDAGNQLRKNDNSILGKMAAVQISELRGKNSIGNRIYLIDSLKHPDEVNVLRDIYGNGFYLFAIHSSVEQRQNFLKNNCNISLEDNRNRLIERDQKEEGKNGQSTSTAFHLADFFLSENGENKKTWNSLQRYFDLIFGDPFRTPTFNEYSMFMAHASSMRSADLSRQVGAVITRDKDIISSGSNECPKAFGGTYWPSFNETTKEIYDEPFGRDYLIGSDFNQKQKEEIIEKLRDGLPTASLEIFDRNLEKSGLKDITEYGRVVHAEMDAILGCARRAESTYRCKMFCTTYPCHNCAKHIVASGIDTVVYIEPYPKSKALSMHSDSITDDDSKPENKVLFTPFIGVGPRQYINLFSMHLSVGHKMIRKKENSYEKIEWKRESAFPRVKMLEYTYLAIESALRNEISVSFKKKLNLRIPK